MPRTGGRSAPAIETGRTRILMMVGLAVFAFTAICVRLVDLAMFQVAEEPATARVAYKVGVATQRGDIVDRNGVLLATNLTTASLYAKPHEITNGNKIANQLATILPDLDIQSVAEKLNGDSRFLWIRRNLTPRQQWQINRLGQPGLDFQTEEARVYPQGALSAHLLGYADIDNNGLAGIEKTYDKSLRTNRDPVQVSLDIRVQHVLHDELSRAVAEFSAIGAAGIILNVRNSEVVALVSLPDFDPNHPSDAAPDQRFNRATLGVYEVGSTFKIFTTAIALDTGVVDLSGGYDASQPIRISRYSIRDFHPENRWLSVPEIFMYSSNIGAAKMALDVGGETQRAYLSQLGLLDSLPNALAESGTPMIPRPWRSINTMTIGFGHGIAISALHLAAGAAATINGGLYNPPAFVMQSQGMSETSPMGRRVFSEATSLQMRKLMRLVVEKGTGRKGAAPGYLVGGKTGTAETLSAGSYSSDKLLSSFVGVFPINDPRYLVLIMLEGPKGNKRTHGFASGGWTAAPVVGRVIQRMAPFAAIAPIDEEAPEIRRQLAIEIAPKRPRLASY